MQDPIYKANELADTRDRVTQLLRDAAYQDVLANTISGFELAVEAERERQAEDARTIDVCPGCGSVMEEAVRRANVTVVVHGELRQVRKRRAVLRCPDCEYVIDPEGTN